MMMQIKLILIVSAILLIGAATLGFLLGAFENWFATPSCRQYAQNSLIKNKEFFDQMSKEERQTHIDWLYNYCKNR